MELDVEQKMDYFEGADMVLSILGLSIINPDDDQLSIIY